MLIPFIILNAATPATIKFSPIEDSCSTYVSRQMSNYVCSPSGMEKMLSFLALCSFDTTQEEILTVLGDFSKEYLIEQIGYMQKTAGLPVFPDTPITLSNQKFFQDLRACRPPISLGPIQSFLPTLRGLIEINKLIETQSNNQINGFLEDDSFEKPLIILNAGSYKINWQFSFLPSLNFSYIFTNHKGQRHRVPVMYKLISADQVEFLLEGPIVALKLKTADNMSIIFARNSSTGSGHLNKEEWSYILNNIKRGEDAQYVKIYLPQHNFQTGQDSQSIRTLLTEMGIKSLYRSPQIMGLNLDVPTYTGPGTYQKFRIAWGNDGVEESIIPEAAPSYSVKDIKFFGGFEFLMLNEDLLNKGQLFAAFPLMGYCALPELASNPLVNPCALLTCLKEQTGYPSASRVIKLFQSPNGLERVLELYGGIRAISVDELRDLLQKLFAIPLKLKIKDLEDLETLETLDAFLTQKRIDTKAIKYVYPIKFDTKYFGKVGVKRLERLQNFSVFREVCEDGEKRPAKLTKAVAFLEIDMPPIDLVQNTFQTFGISEVFKLYGGLMKMTSRKVEDMLQKLFAPGMTFQISTARDIESIRDLDIILPVQSIADPIKNVFRLKYKSGFSQEQIYNLHTLDNFTAVPFVKQTERGIFRNPFKTQVRAISFDENF